MRPKDFFYETEKHRKVWNRKQVDSQKKPALKNGLASFRRAKCQEIKSVRL